jgi:hypothetical protein
MSYLSNDETPEGFEGTDPKEWADWAVNGPRTSSGDILAERVNGVNQARDAALGGLVLQEEAGLTSEARHTQSVVTDEPDPASEWESDEFESEELPDLESLSPEDAALNYAKSQIDAALAGFDQTDPGVQAWKEEYDARQLAWRQEQVEQAWNEGERILDSAARQAGNTYDVKQAAESGQIRELMSEAYQTLAAGLTSQGATEAEANQVIMQHFGSDENLAAGIAEAAAVAARNKAITNLALRRFR